jgi:predicted dehydrogenase
MIDKTRFAIVGSGWRSEFFFRIAQELPGLFEITGVLARTSERAQSIEGRWSIPAVSQLDSLLAEKPAFVVTSVPSTANPSLLMELSQRRVPVLSETPPAADLTALVALNQQLGAEARVQVAEQYQYQPLNAAIVALVQSGRLGSVTQVQVSVAHGYHGISLLRKLLGVQFENAEIRTLRFSSPIIAGPGRDGPPASQVLTESSQLVATLRFPERLGVFDFTDDQYFSWIRSRRLLVRGDRGEINNERVRYLQDHRTPITEDLTRVDAGQDGNLEGYYHKGILSGSSWLYVNPFSGARLSDDEIAVATCLQKMGEYVEGGPSFYSLAEASQDHYLALEMQSSHALEATVSTHSQCWAD